LPAARPREREDGKVALRGVRERPQNALAKETGLSIQREFILKCVKRFTRGVIIGGH
jgi:hypothetical protein